MANFRKISWVVLALMIVGGIATVSSYAQNTSALGNQPALVPVSINKASADELQTITGIGPVIAERIVEYRESNGAFEVLEDLMDVHGIGQAKFERIKDRIKL